MVSKYWETVRLTPSKNWFDVKVVSTSEKDYIIGQIYWYKTQILTHKRFKENKVKDIYNQLNHLFSHNYRVWELRERFKRCLEQMQVEKLGYLISDKDKEHFNL